MIKFTVVLLYLFSIFLISIVFKKLKEDSKEIVRKIIHVGIILEENYIIHASGKVRIDRIDQQGIFNNKIGTHTHKLRLIKSIC